LDKSPEREGTAVLVDLGCTLSQARVYIALIQIGVSKIKSITEATGIQRENIYKIIHSLENKGLIEKELGSPARYRAVSPEEALPMLFKHKQTQIARLKTESQTIMEKLKKKSVHNSEPQGESSQFTLIPGRNVIIERLKQALQKAQISVDTITSQKRFSRAILEFAEDYKEALERGVKIRIATEKHLAEKAALETLQTLTKNPAFEIRYFSDYPQSIAAIFDHKESFISVSATAHLNGAASLWSNNSNLVNIAQTYFNNKWNNAQA
jgi:sugar-specific transcriptional regulator TrmB